MNFEYLRKWVFLVVAFGLLSGCASTGPYNTTAEGGDEQLMLKGHDPVAYFTAGKHMLGNAGIKTVYDGVTYRFVTEESKVQFLKEPTKYVPQFGGYCSNGIVYGIPWGGDPDAWKMIDGKLYIFGGETSKKYFLMDEKQNLALANRYWNDEIKGGSAVTQRYKRLVFRVPHYKTGKELEEEWQKRPAQK